MKKIVWWGVGILLLMMGLVWWQWPKPGVRMVMCDVGQGDAILIMEGFSQLLIDTGPERGGVSACLGSNMPFWDMFVETVVITHTDSDHMGGLESVLNHYRVGKVITSQAAANRLQTIMKDRSKVSVSWQGQQWRFGSILGVVKWPAYSDNEGLGGLDSSKNESDTNAQSLVVRLQWNGQSLWMAADSDGRVEEHLLELGLVEPTTILKVAHHGSASASSEPFLMILQPLQAWISVGKDNRYGHPTPEVLERLSGAGIQIRRTDKEGDISTN